MDLSGVIDSVETSRKLPVAAILAAAGVETFGMSAKCPFHQDDNPSLSIWTTDSGHQLWKCFGCDASGDVYSLVKRLWPDQDPDSIISAVPDPKPLPQPPKFKAESWIHFLSEHTGTGKSLKIIERFLELKNLNVDVYYLSSQWRVAGAYDRIYIPHYDVHRTLIGLKTRSATDPYDKPRAIAGSRLSGTLYGEWRLSAHPKVVLTEGESCTWAAGYVNSRAYGLPTGSRSGLTTTPLVGVRDVDLAFDGDAAGREATTRWRHYLMSKGYTVTLTDMREGDDYASSFCRRRNNHEL